LFAKIVTGRGVEMDDTLKDPEIAALALQFAASNY